MKIITDSQKIDELLVRGVENIYPKKEFLESLLKSGKKLTLYTGYDPTAPTLHIGHGITMMKLRQFQDLGHKVIMLIGDFTGMIGDPTDKTSARQVLTRDQVLENCKNYKEQASLILNFKGKNSAQIKYNSEWFKKMSFANVIDLTSQFTVQRMLERDMFERRYRGEIKCIFCDNVFTQPYSTLSDNSTTSEGVDFPKITKCSKCGRTVEEMLNSNNNEKKLSIFTSPKPIYLHEFLYPVMQAYDSVRLDVDGEVGGNDQTFNMLAGRELMKKMKGKEKFVLTTKLLVDASGKKMGKSEGNMIALNDEPEEMYGKVMSWADDMIVRGFELCTNVGMDEVKKIEKEFKDADPRDLKMKLAYEITKAFLGEESGKKGEEYFVKVIQNKEKPDSMMELSPKEKDIVSVLVEAGFVKSTSEARRAIDDGGVKINDEKVLKIDVQVKSGDIVQKGKRFFVKIK